MTCSLMNIFQYLSSDKGIFIHAISWVKHIKKRSPSYKFGKAHLLNHNLINGLTAENAVSKMKI